jgi:hypothetical protein
MSYPNDDDDEGWDGPDDDEPDTVTCPYCREDIYEDTVRCPRCGNYISQEDSPPGLKPWWIVIGVFAVLAIVAMWVFQGW